MPYSDVAIELPCTGLTPDAPADDLYQAGIAYSTGTGVEEDLIAAHKWFNLAALRGSEEAKQSRKDISEYMSKDEIAEAQKAAREWLRTMN